METSEGEETTELCDRILIDDSLYVWNLMDVNTMCRWRGTFCVRVTQHVVIDHTYCHSHQEDDSEEEEDELEEESEEEEEEETKPPPRKQQQV